MGNTYFSSLFFLILPGLFLLGCSAQDEGGSSKIRLKLPEAFNKSQQVGSLSQSSCFAVSISGDNINSVPGTNCDPPMGEFYGLVKAGETIEIELDRGLGRSIDIFYVTDSTGCRPFDPTLGLGATFGSNKVYRVAHHEGIDMNQAEVQVVVEVDFPKRANSFSQIFSAPSSCEITPPVLATLAPPARSSVGTYREVMVDGKTLSIRVGGQKTNVQPLNNFSGRLTPYNLGVE